MNMSNAAGILTATAWREECTVRQLTACTVTNKSRTRTSARTHTLWTAQLVTTCLDQASPIICTLLTQLASQEIPSAQVCPLLNLSVTLYNLCFSFYFVHACYIFSILSICWEIQISLKLCWDLTQDSISINLQKSYLKT